MTERQIQDELWTRLRANGHDWMMPNYTPPQWWECDMFSVTAAGFMVEHEIKLSVSDFRADAKKYRNHFDRTTRTSTKNTKHDLLGDPARKSGLKGPARFFFVVPEGLIALDECPEFAGLVYVSQARYGTLSFRQPKQAPKLHSEKCDPKVIAHISKICFWRYWTNRAPRDPGGRVNDYEI